jgi:hypothetical protein
MLRFVVLEETEQLFVEFFALPLVFLPFFVKLD